MGEFDPFAPGVLADPYPHYRRLRDEAPCYRVPGRDIWVVSRFDDVVAVARNHTDYSSTGGVGPDWNQRPMMPMYDPPEHTRLRRLVAPFFTPRTTRSLEERIVGHVGELFGRMAEAGGGDLVTELAVPLSVSVIADILGVPQERRAEFRTWSAGIVADLAGDVDDETAAHIEERRRAFVAYLKELVAERRKTKPSEEDVISLLLHANEADRLAHHEVIAFCVLLLVAGFETTVNAIANGVLALLDHPGEWRRLVEDPSLVPSMVEEFVRYDPPVQSFFRNTLRPAVVAGVEIPAKVKVMVLFGSANRDERRFPSPDRFRVDRSAQDHVGYGAGIHYCLGAPLARAEIAAVGRALLGSVSSMEPAGEIVRTTNVLFRGVSHLPLAFRMR